MTTRPPWLTLAALGAALVLLPLGLGLPGLPMTLRADETSHYFLARSLAFDGDSVADAVDVDRIYREMPYSGREHLALGSDDDWTTARWAVTPLYAALLAPVVAVARTNGAFAFNAACFVLALSLLGHGLVTRHGRDGDTSLPWVVAASALILSGAFVYVWWIHPASLRLLLVAAAFHFGWRTRVEPSTYTPVRSALRLAAAGACLGLCVVEVPWLAVLAPALFVRHRASLRRVAALACGLLAGAGGALLVGWLVLGHLGPHDFAQQAVFEVDSPDDLPWQAAADDAGYEGSLGPWTADGLAPAPGARTLAEQLGQSLVGRHRGLLLLFPFAAFFAAAASRRSRRGDDDDVLARLLLTAGVAALVLGRPFSDASALDLERFGDPVLAAAWPAFFFLPAALPGALPTLAAVALSALLLTPAIFTPFGPPVPFGEAHHATRGGVARRLPMDLREVSVAAGWQVHELCGSFEESLRLWVPAYAGQRVGSSLALLGGERVEMWIEAARPVSALSFDVQSFAPGNRLTLDFATGRQRYEFPGETPPDATRVRLPLDNGWRPARRSDGAEVYVTRLVATTTTGERPSWRAGIEESYYVGALLTALGSDEHLGRNVWNVQWSACGAPPTAAPGEPLLVLARLRNGSEADWLDAEPVRVRLAHRWRGTDGRVIESPVRADFDGAVAAGEEALAWVAVEAPAEPGTWQLEIEPVYELVGWFSDHMDAASAVCLAEVVVRE